MPGEGRNEKGRKEERGRRNGRTDEIHMAPLAETAPALGRSAYKPAIAADPIRLPSVSPPILAAHIPALSATALPVELPHASPPGT